MLTEREKKWLRQRELFQYRYCKHCKHKPLCKDYNFIIGVCPTLRHPEDWQDAAEFAERVAEKLAINDTSYLPCHQKGHENQCPYDNYCPTDKKKTAWCKIKHAMLQVEEEMDG